MLLKTKAFALIPFLFLSFSLLAGENDSLQVEDEMTEDEIAYLLDSLDNSLNYKSGTIDISNGLAVIEVPANYKYLNPEQSAYVLTDLWGNPPSENLGMLFVKEESPFDNEDFSYAVEITYSEEGYIEDDDAKDLDYDDLLEEMQNDTREASIERVKQGYPAIDLIGWASPPFYDATNKKLHWAKEIKFGTDEVNTLNYNIRVLGRKGYLNLNVIGDIDQLANVQENVEAILASVEFKQGNTYSDFDPDIDDIAAYGIGGLIAGKVLAKAGIIALIIKFWKFIALGAVGLFAGARKYFMKPKNEGQEEIAETTDSEENEAEKE